MIFGLRSPSEACTIGSGIKRISDRMVESSHHDEPTSPIYGTIIATVASTFLTIRISENWRDDIWTKPCHSGTLDGLQTIG
jgi:hypothetical protein